MEGALAECIFHREHTICGRTMRPFSIWHAWLLEFVKSPFLIGGKVAAADLALALEICSRPASFPEQALPLALTPDADFLRALVTAGLADTGDAFARYLEDYLALPSCWSSSDGKPVRSPICLYLVAILMRHGSRTEPQAWATQYGYGRHLVLALAEAGGNEIPLISDAEEQALREAGHLPALTESKVDGRESKASTERGDSQNSEALDLRPSTLDSASAPLQ